MASPSPDLSSLSVRKDQCMLPGYSSVSSHLQGGKLWLEDEPCGTLLRLMPVTGWDPVFRLGTDGRWCFRWMSFAVSP